MEPDTLDARVSVDSGGVFFSIRGSAPHWLHPLWLRERSEGPNAVDSVNGQRLYDPSRLDPLLSVLDVRDVAGKINLVFSDGVTCVVSPHKIAIEVGALPDPQAPPIPEHWDGSLSPRPDFRWDENNDPDELFNALNGFFKYGFCVFRDTPTELGALRQLVQRFGFIRETNFGRLFNVEKKENADDLAYTDSALVAHTDNPYRVPVPGIQFLHCLENSVAGGLSTIVDGFAIACQLETEAPDQSDILSKTLVRFRYEAAGGAILQDFAPIIERDRNGDLKRIRLSSRLDFVPPLPRDELSLFFAGRRRLQELAAESMFEIRSTFEPGMLLMMDNYRTLHGRTAYDSGVGVRRLQGCYIDHDGPDGVYRMLVRDRALKGMDFA